MKAKSLKLSLLALLLQSFAIAQTTVIDYQPWSTSQCNAFGNSPTIGGLVHETTVGQPTNGGGNPVSLQCQYNGSAPMGTEYVIVKDFLPNHQYVVVVEAATITNNNMFPNLQLTLVPAPAGSNSLCNGPSSIITTSGAQSQPIGSSVYSPFSFAFNLGANQVFTGIAIAAVPDFGSINTSATQWVVIRKITITDNTPQPPTFTLTSNSSTRLCGTQNPVTFTINNPSNAPVTGYNFKPEPNKWIYQGAAAPATINSSTNSITLTPVSCGGAMSVTGQAIWQGQNVSTNTLTMAVTFPDIKLSGPDNLDANVAGYFDVQGVVSTPSNYSWPCTSTRTDLWSSSIPNQSYFYNTSGSPFNTYFYTNYNIPSQVITVNKTVYMCDVARTVSKNVRIRGAIGHKMSNADLSISIAPNPSNGRFGIFFNKTVSEAQMTVTTIDGKVIINREISDTNEEIDLTSYPTGIYIVKIFTDGYQWINKIVKK